MQRHNASADSGVILRDSLGLRRGASTPPYTHLRQYRQRHKDTGCEMLHDLQCFMLMLVQADSVRASACTASRTYPNIS